MANSLSMKLACLVLMFMVAGAPLASAVIPCNTVARNIGSCIAYLKNGGIVPGQCCNGIRYLNSVAYTPLDRQSICRCLVDAAKRTRGLRPNLMAGLPNQCGVRLPYTIGPYTNCNGIR